MVMSWRTVIDTCVDIMPSFLRQRQQALALDYWLDGKQGTQNAERTGIFVPNAYRQTEEHLDLSERSYTPWAELVVTSLAQTMFLEGIRMPGSQENLGAWEAWQRNNMDDVQSRLYRGALGHGVSYATALPGNDRLTGRGMAKIRAYSSKRLAAFYADDEEEFPLFFMICDLIPPGTDGTAEHGWQVQFVDEQAVYYLACKGDGLDKRDWTPISYDTHGLPVPPLVRYASFMDLDGRAHGEIEPVIPILRRIDQDTYDRLIVQRYGAWKVRYITGLVKPKEMTDEQYRQGLMKLKIGDFLTAVDKDTRFGTLDETQLEGFIHARDADIRDLAAVRQIPPHHLLGTTPQMQPESLASINSSLQARSLEHRTSFGESHERLLRLSAVIMGNRTEAEAWDLQVRWRDTETRSLSQTADALGKVATQLKVPVEMLWERIEGWTDSDTARAKGLIQDGTIDQLLAEFEANGLLQPQQRGGVPSGGPQQ